MRCNYTIVIAYSIGIVNYFVRVGILFIEKTKFKDEYLYSH